MSKKENKSKTMGSFGSSIRRVAMAGDSIGRGFSRMGSSASTMTRATSSRVNSGLDAAGRKVGNFFGRK